MKAVIDLFRKDPAFKEDLREAQETANSHLNRHDPSEAFDNDQWVTDPKVYK
jgi:hypothetical protein